MLKIIFLGPKKDLNLVSEFCLGKLTCHFLTFPHFSKYPDFFLFVYIRRYEGDKEWKP